MTKCLQRAFKAGNASPVGQEVSIYHGRRTRSRTQYLDRLRYEDRHQDIQEAAHARVKAAEKRALERYHNAIAPRKKPGFLKRVADYIGKALGKQ